MKKVLMGAVAICLVALTPSSILSADEESKAEQPKGKQFPSTPTSRVAVQHIEEADKLKKTTDSKGQSINASGRNQGSSVGTRSMKEGYSVGVMIVQRNQAGMETGKAYEVTAAE